MASYTADNLIEKIIDSDVEGVRTLLEAGCDPNGLPSKERDPHLNPPLNWVCIKKNHFEEADTKIARMLLAKGADPTVGNSGALNALMVASYFGYKGVVELLIQDGRANLYALDIPNERTAVEFAQIRGHREIAEIIQAAMHNANAIPKPPSPLPRTERAVAELMRRKPG